MAVPLVMCVSANGEKKPRAIIKSLVNVSRKNVIQVIANDDTVLQWTYYFVCIRNPGQMFKMRDSLKNGC